MTEIGSLTTALAKDFKKRPYEKGTKTKYRDTEE